LEETANKKEVTGATGGCSCCTKDWVEEKPFGFPQKMGMLLDQWP